MKTKSLRKILLGISASALSCTMVLSVLLPNFGRIASDPSGNSESESTLLRDITGSTKNCLEDFLDTSVVQKLPSTVAPEQEISIMLALADTDTILDGYDALGNTSMTVADFIASRQGKAIVSNIERQNKVLQSKLDRAGIHYEMGVSYNTLMSGFEVVINSNQFEALQKAVGKSANVFVSEVYEECKTEIVENEVNVYDTGIFDSSDSDYDGSGTVIAVLDTGLDYTHSAFNEALFTPSADDVITMDTLTGIVNKLAAASTTKGLTANALYLSRKVPFAYDYADKDPDVYPINSEHGTHVAGVMVGKDSTITGVAPNAQLAVMKVFSEAVQGAKQSWIVAALEDCVTLGVDVINMSLGSSCGFSREIDEDQRTAVYDAIKARGISLVAAASNDYNSTMSSTKNGNLGLTSNPDSATVGSPSTYDSALSVASISGTKTPYLLHDGNIIYFKEARDNASEEKNFVEEIFANLGTSESSVELEYVTVPAIGREEDYNSIDVKGKIALVRRGQTNFEDKVRIAGEQGAIGCIIYNNVPGDIAMTIGHAQLPACSVNMDDGIALTSVSDGIGRITISLDQVAGPFMSDFSSWGPTPDLGIKPEITAHGGNILSSVPGQRYDRLSGTSMASPNQAGVTALVRQYVKETFPGYNSVQIAATVNQLLMSTTDIANNTNSLPFSVRKQGAGLANLTKATTTPAYIRTYVRDAYDRRVEKTGEYEISDKAKLELGDDPDKTGLYTFSFELVNFGNSTVSYNVGALVLTEGVSEQLTIRGDYTVTETGYLLDGAQISVTGITDGSVNGNTISVGAKTTAVVSFQIELSEKDKDYLEQNFANGMYVEGFVTLTASGDTKVNLNVPFLTFYGDWTQAPMFDLDYYETHRDELNENLLDEEKVLPDAYATRPIGGLYEDYIAYLGAFPYLQDPNSTNIVSAQRERIALTNQEGESGGVNSISQIWAGLLRGAKRMVMTITDDSTGEVIWTRTEENVYKASYRSGSIAPSRVDVEFNVREHELKNNTKYTFRMVGYLDYADGGVDTNVKNSFEFSFYTDFQAPIITDVQYRSVYDNDLKKNRLYADVSIFDNHYTTGFIAGFISQNADYNPNDADSYLYSLGSFGRYITPVGGSRNSTNVVEVELTDYLDKIKDESYDGRSWIVQTMDCALNSSTYEFQIPDEILSISFKEMEAENEGDTVGVRISPNEIYKLDPVIFPTQDKSWAETINYVSSDESVVRVISGQLIGVSAGTATITATANTDDTVRAELTVTVLKEGDKGYVAYDRLEAESFNLRGYYVNKVFYRISSSDRDLGVDYAYSESGVQRFVEFTSHNSYALSMFPSESVTIECDIKGFDDPDKYKVVYTSNNPDVAEVEQDGTITAYNVRRYTNQDGTETVVPQNTDRTTTISISLYMLDANNEWKQTRFSQSITISVKKPYTTQGPWIMSYMGLGGTVEVPEDLGANTVYQYAFSNYNLIPKDLSAGDEITEEDPYYSKTWFIGEDTIKEIILPEGIEIIESYAFAGLTGLERIVLPTTLLKIQTGAFYGCTSLKTVEFRDGKNNLQFINGNGFYQCSSLQEFDFSSIIAFGDGAFEGADLRSIELPVSAQSIGARAFLGNSRLASLSIKASRVKIGANAFAGCERLSAVSINASVIPEGVFDNCAQLMTVSLGPDVSVIGQYAFRHTSVASFTVQSGNSVYEAQDGGNYLLEKGTGKLALVAPTVAQFKPSNSNITTVATGAFSTAGSKLTSVILPSVTAVEDYAFAYCSSLKTITLGTLQQVGQYAFYNTALTALPRLGAGVAIGDYAFAMTQVNTINLADNSNVGNFAFSDITTLTSLTIGDGAQLGERAFYGDFKLSSVTIGKDAVIGKGAFEAITSNLYSPDATFCLSQNSVSYYGQSSYSKITPTVSALSRISIGENAQIGDYAFYGAGPGPYTYLAESGSGVAQVTLPNGTLRNVTLGKGATIGNYAFFGCRYLTSIDLSGALSIGDYAFSGLIDEVINFASGEVLKVGTFNLAPSMTSVNLSQAKTIGTGAFEGNTALTSVTLNPEITKLGASSFSGCTALNSIDLSHLDEIGESALYSTAIARVELKEGVTIQNLAFAAVSSLAEVSGLEKAVSIGDGAFMGTSLVKADLSSAVNIGTFAFADSALTSVTLGDRLETIGENPFVNCALPAFSKEVNEETLTTFDIGENGIKVINGVLYRTNVNGLELITYPGDMQSETFEIAANTIRIGASAFEGTPVKSVTVNREMKAIGDCAFYGCDQLVVVSFRGRVAPILEEAYDYNYDSGLDEEGYSLYLGDSVGLVIVSFRDGRSFRSGKEIVPYRMWNYNPTTVLYGANFIGWLSGDSLASHTLIMVCPSNGTGYDNFTYQRYFDVYMEGRAAITDAALDVIARIEAMPALGNLSVGDAELVNSIRALYDALDAEDQAYLNSEGYYRTLSSAENIINGLLDQENPPVDPPVDPGEATSSGPWKTVSIVMIVITAVLAVAFVAVLLLKRKPANDEEDSQNSEEEKSDKSDEE